MSLDKFSSDVLIHCTSYLLEESGVSYAITQKPKDPKYYHFSFMEGGNVFYQWHTWSDTREGATIQAFLQLLGAGLIAKFPDNFQFKDGQNG